MNNSTSYEIIASYLPKHISEALRKIPAADRENLSEVRLRRGRPVSLVYPDKSLFLAKNGTLASLRFNADLITVSSEEITSVVQSLSRYSLHSKSRELAQGFFVIENGIRVGVSGAFSETDPPILRSFFGLNFRISRQVLGCGAEIFRLLMRGGGSVLICGEVNSGKTTVLRDICRLCGDRWKVALIDERSEIGSTWDVGTMTDVLSGCDRSKGITMAVRTLSPDMIFCDEISTDSDQQAIFRAYGSGVRFAATIHASSYDDLLRRRIAADLLEKRVFDHAVFLAGSSFPGRISEIRRLSRA